MMFATSKHVFKIKTCRNLLKNHDFLSAVLIFWFCCCFLNLLIGISFWKTLVPGFMSLPGTVLSADSGAPPAAVPPRYSFDVRELTAHPVQEAPAPVSGACSPSK